MTLILIADDHPIAREPLAKLLSYEGYETACAANGIEALDAVRARRPDLILLDLMMPKMNGLAFLRAISRSPSGSRCPSGAGYEAGQEAGHDAAGHPGVPEAGDVPVILLTGITDCSDVQQARELGVREVIPKAKFTVDELLRRIRSHLPEVDRVAGNAA
jgi:CheY-like chemotaxis protein